MINSTDFGSISVLPNMPKGKYDIVRVEDEETLIVELEKNNNRKVVISFGNGVIAYQKLDESCDFSRVYKLMSYLEEKNISTDTLYLVEESSMVKEIENKSSSFFKKAQLKHYLIVASNYLMDVITYDEYAIISKN